MQESYKRESDRKRYRVQNRPRGEEGSTRQLAKVYQHRFQHGRDGRFAYPAKTQGRERDAQLGSRDICVEIVEHAEQPLGRRIALGGHGLDPRFAYRDQRKLACDKEPVSEYQYDDKQQLER
jgi:hypothetical protein